MKSQIRTMKGMLSALSRFYQDETVDCEEQEKLWNVLSALRGPDRQDASQDTVKHATTAVIRTAALGNTMNAPAHFADNDSEAQRATRARMGKAGTWGANHFTHHAMDAFESLGLSWAGVNEGIDGWLNTPK